MVKKLCSVLLIILLVVGCGKENKDYQVVETPTQETTNSQNELQEETTVEESDPVFEKTTEYIINDMDDLVDSIKDHYSQSGFAGELYVGYEGELLSVVYNFRNVPIIQLDELQGNILSNIYLQNILKIENNQLNLTEDNISIAILSQTGCYYRLGDSIVWFPTESTQDNETVTEEVETTGETDVQGEEEVQGEVVEDNVYQVNYFGDPSFELKVVSVRYTNERNSYYDGVPVESVAVIRIEGVNRGTETYYLSDSYFNFYDGDGNKLTTYPNTDHEYSIIEELNPNRKGTIEISIGIPKGTKLEIEVMSDVSSSRAEILDNLFFE